MSKWTIESLCDSILWDILLVLEEAMIEIGATYGSLTL